MEKMIDRYLFKAKRIDNGEWVEGFIDIHTFIPLEESGKEPYLGTVIKKVAVRLYDYDSYEVDESTICQCTGLKDINGNLIWENDIVLYGSDYPTLKKGVVKYHAPKYLLKIHHDGYSYNHDLTDFEEVDTGHEHYYIHFKYKVIGNVFDNPELLESEV